jgi:hypothetical protein
VRQTLLDLYEIQKIDLGLREQEKRRASLPEQLTKLEGSAQTLRRQIATLTEQSAGALREARSLQSLLDAEKDKVRKWESRLNDIRNQREYQALQRETEGSRRANRDYEEKINELYAAKEKHDTDLSGIQARLNELETTLAAEKQHVDGQTEALDTLIAAEQQRRDALIPRVPKALFRTYDAIRSRRMGVGLSPVTQGCCTGCNIRLPPQLYNILQRADTIEQCPSCRRVMVWDSLLEPDAEDAQAGSAQATGTPAEGTA